MGIATPISLQFLDKYNQNSSLISMSQDYHQGILNFSNGFERSPPPQQQPSHHHVAQQIRRDKLRVQGFDPPPPLVGIDDEDSVSGGLPVNYENAGMLSEMFNFPSGGATELLENQILQNYRNPRQATPSSAVDWFPVHRAVNADSAAAMQLFLMNPQQQQEQRSPSPSPTNPPPSHESTSSTLHMLLPNPSGAGGAFGQFTWVNNPNENNHNPSEIPGVVEGQGLSLSLSSSLQHLEAAKAEEELRMGEGNMLFFGQGGGSGSTPSAQYLFKNLGGHGHQLHVGVGSPASSSSYGAMHMLRNSKYAKAAQELLEEFCSVGRGQFIRKNIFRRQNNDNGNPSSLGGGGGGNSSSSAKNINPPLSAADRIEHQRRKVKLLSMLDEVERRYNHYCEQMQMVVNSFDMVLGFGSAVPYTCLAQKAMSRHFRCLKDAIAGQLKHSCELLGEKDAGATGVTRGETPRLRILEQSLRQQRAFHQMGGMMEQEAWRPQRGLPERSVNILRAWLFEHFLHPYPSDADKHLLARQTGLSRNQVSNWFINARVRLWKPMVEEMYQQEAKDDGDHESAHDNDDDDQRRDQTNSAIAQTPPPSNNSAPTTATSAATAITPPPPGQRIQTIINANHENDPSFIIINTPRFVSDNQAHHDDPNFSLSSSTAGSTAVHSFPSMHEPANNAEDIEATLIRFGTSTAGDVSLTLGLRHAGNLPEKGHFSVRDFGGC